MPMMVLQVTFLLLVLLAPGSKAFSQQSSLSPAEAVVNLVAANGFNVSGEIKFFQRRSSKVKITGSVHGLPPGEHRLYIHQFGLTSNNCSDAGGHFDPNEENDGHPHGHSHEERHAGDLGNIRGFATEGAVFINLFDFSISLRPYSTYNIVNKALVIHEGEDSLGHAGARMACGTVTLVS